MEKIKELVLEACKNNELYDFICNNFWQMEKQDLVDILLEAIYVAKNDEEIGNELSDWRWNNESE